MEGAVTRLGLGGYSTRTYGSFGGKNTEQVAVPPVSTHVVISTLAYVTLEMEVGENTSEIQLAGAA